MERAALASMSTLLHEPDLEPQPDTPLASTTQPSTPSSPFDDDTIRGSRHPALLLPTMNASDYMICVTSPSDDDFLTPKISPHPYTPRHRRSSHIERWIQQQQSQPSSPETNTHQDASPLTVGTPCNPYLAYPHLNTIFIDNSPNEDNSSVHSYDLMDDTDIPEVEELSSTSQVTHSATPPTSRPPSLTPSTPNSHLSARRPSSLVSGSPERIPFPKSLNNRSLASTTPQTRGRPPTAPTPSTSTLGTNVPLPRPVSELKRESKYSPWRWRPSVHGHIASHSIPHVHVSDTLAPPRHSLSSAASHTSHSATATMSSAEGDQVADNMSFISSLRSRAFKSKSRPGSILQSPSHSEWSLPMPEESASMSTPALPRKPSTLRLPFSPRLKKGHVPSQSEPAAPAVAYSSAHRSSLPRVSFSGPGRSRRKKKLVVTGIGVDEVDRFEALKRWCESFGEVSQITRMPDGELHVHFKKATVADTVCRVRAQVQIPDVGSVFLSWYTGNKP